MSEVRAMGEPFPGFGLDNEWRSPIEKMTTAELQEMNKAIRDVLLTRECEAQIAGIKCNAQWGHGWEDHWTRVTTPSGDKAILNWSLTGDMSVD